MYLCTCTISHHNQCLLISGDEGKRTVGDRSLRYLSLHDNKILREFLGHSGNINDISMSPVDDSFLTCSNDRTMKLWDLKQAGPIAEMATPQSGNGMVLGDGAPHASYDSTGLVFGVTAPLDQGAGHVSDYFRSHSYFVSYRTFGLIAFCETLIFAIADTSLRRKAIWKRCIC